MNGLEIVRNELAAKYGLNALLESELKRISELATGAQPISIARADAHLLTGLAHLQSCHFVAALPEMEAAVELYTRLTHADSRELGIATWALASSCAYLVYFDVAEDLYEDAISKFCFGEHRDLMLACLADYEHFLGGFLKDEASARAVEFFLSVAS